MKPIYVIFKAFGPYVKEQKVDFEKLEESGLFLICGETGSGKTTILDAMTYALYGQSSGGGRGSIESMRCNLAPKDEDTYIEYVFDSAGKRYKFIRQIKFARKNFNISQNSLVENEEGVFVPIHENPTATKVNQDAEDIIGLSYDQFRQVIILPQGQFEKLLTSDSSEKERILVSIFKAERWQEISEEVYKKAKESADKWKDEKTAIDTKLKEFECSNLEELKTHVELLNEQKRESFAQSEQVKEEKDKVEQKRSQMIVLEKLFTDWHTTEAKIQRQKEREPILDDWIKRLHEGERADKVNPQYEHFSECVSIYNRRENDWKKANETHEKAGESFQRIKEKEKNHLAKSDRVEKAKSDMIKFGELKEIYEKLSDLEGKVKESKKAVETAKKNADKEVAQLNKMNEELLTFQTKQQELFSEHNRLYRTYMADVSGRLAKDLNDGDPCPVCGSIHHPMKAEIQRSDVTDEMLKSIEEDEKKTQIDIDNKREQVEAKKLLSSQADETYALSNNVLTELSTRLDLSYKKRVDGIETLEQLNDQLVRLKKLVEAYDAEDKNIKEQVQNQNDVLIGAKEAVNQADHERKQAAKDQDEAKQILTKAMKEEQIPSYDWLSEHRLEEEERNKLQSDIASEKALTNQLRLLEQEQKKSLDGKEPPDMTKIEDEYRILSETYDDKLQKSTIAAQKYEEASSLYLNLKKRMASFEREYQTSEENLEFAKQLRGDTGVGLQRYVLGVMLSAITAEANELLKNVHGGRYQLYRTDSVSGRGRKAGLELEVRDANANMESRSVRGLSGGEKFLVALSLSIGLSTVAQKRGMKLEAMFIDEGFGSLDQSSIGDALDVLGNIQHSNGLVGIISHVQVLRDNIPAKIQIKKGRNGSNLTSVF